MLRNCLNQDLFILNIVEPVDFSTYKRYIFLGNPPDNVRTAMKQALVGEPTQSQKKTLCAYYGNKWKNRTGLDIPMNKKMVKYVLKGNTMTKIGGDNPSLEEEYEVLPKYSCEYLGASEFEDFNMSEDDFSNFKITADDIAAAEKKAAVNIERVVDFTYKDIGKGVELVEDHYIYPEDNMMQLKEKIFLLTGIPIYRQHLFYQISGVNFTTYRIRLDGEISNQIVEYDQFPDKVAGLHYDRFMVDHKDSIQYEAKDEFIIVDSYMCDYQVFLADLESFLKPKRAILRTLVSDTFTIDAIFYGFVQKYFPMFRRDMFITYLLNETEIANYYKYMSLNTDLLTRKYEKEAMLLNRSYGLTKLRSDNMEKLMKFAITDIRIQPKISMPRDQTIVNTRILFDMLTTDGNRVLVRYSNMNRHVDKVYVAFRFTSGYNKLINKSGLLELETGISIVIQVPGNINRFIVLNISPNMSYFVRTTWDVENNMDFVRITDVCAKYVNPIIKEINNLGNKIYNRIINYQLPLIKEGMVKYNKMTCSIIINKLIQLDKFRQLRALLKNYEDSGIIRFSDSQLPNVIDFTFMKGVHEYSSEFKMRGQDVQNHYIYLHEETYWQRWRYLYRGKKTEIINRSADMLVQLTNYSILNFQLFYFYLIPMLSDWIDSNKVRETETKSTKKNKRLQELDPNLYSLKKYGSNKVYSRICQGKKQPNIFTDEEYSKLPAETRKKIVKFWNFTTEKTAYYSCSNSKYPMLAFKPEDHPLGYCLPCCQKVVKGNLGKIQKCMRDRVYDRQDASGNVKYIIKYEKPATVGRYQYLNQQLGNIFYDFPELLIFGTPQSYIEKINIGVIHCLSYLLEMPIDNLGMDMIARVKKTPNVFTNMPNNTYFDSFDKFVAEFSRLFIRGKFDIHDYAYKWNKILLYLIANLYGVTPVIFEDNDNMSIKLQGRAGFLIRKKIPTKYILLVKKHKDYHPIILFDDIKNITEPKQRVFDYDSPVIEALRDFIYAKQQVVDDKFDIDNIVKITEEMGFKAKKYFINQQDILYGVLFMNRDRGLYVEITPTYYRYDKSIDVSYKYINRKKYNLDIADVKDLFDKLNFRGQSFYIKLKAKIIGIQLDGKYCWFNEFECADCHDYIVEYMHDPYDVNEAISAGAPLNDGRLTKSAKGQYSLHTWNLFRNTIMRDLVKKKDNSIRAAITKIFNQPDLTKDAPKYVYAIFKLLEKYRNDYDIIFHGILVNVFRGNYTAKAALAMIDEMPFVFDSATQLNISDQDLGKLLDASIDRNIEIVNEINIDSFPQHFLTCREDGKTSICKRGKLLMTLADVKKWRGYAYKVLQRHRALPKFLPIIVDENTYSCESFETLEYTGFI